MCCLLLVGTTSCASTIKNKKIESFTVNGNCGMCEKTIESAGNVKGIALVDWDRNTKKASIFYDSVKTNSKEILQRIALVGYDNEEFIAPTETYSKLPGCCQYVRSMDNSKMMNNMPNMSNESNISIDTEKNTTNQIQELLKNYILLKDALVNSDGAKAKSATEILLKNVNSIQMDLLTKSEHMVWMKSNKEIKENLKGISNSKDISQQRVFFASLSDLMFDLMEVANLDETVYYQHCPMAFDGKGGNWLSLESTIKNPFYGKMMLSCGKTTEIIQK